MQGDQRVLEQINKLIALEMGAIAEYAAHQAYASNWGLGKLAGKTMARADRKSVV